MQRILQQESNYSLEEITQACIYLAEAEIQEEKLQHIQLRLIGGNRTIKGARTYLDTLSYNLLMKFHNNEQFKSFYAENKESILDVFSRINDHRSVMAILCTSFDKNHPQFKDKVESYFKRTNLEGMDTVTAFLAYWITKTDPTFSEETVKRFEKLSNQQSQWPRALRTGDQTNLIISEAIQTHSGDKVEQEVEVDGFMVPMYLRESNTVILPYARMLTMFDQQTTNYKYDGLMRILNNLPSKPRVVPINFYEFAKKNSQDQASFCLEHGLGKA